MNNWEIGYNAGLSHGDGMTNMEIAHQIETVAREAADRLEADGWDADEADATVKDLGYIAGINL